MTVTYHEDVVQGSDAWLALRCGRLTASEMKKVITPKLKIADNADTRAHVYEMAFQRISSFVEPQYVSDAMLRGQADEYYARQEYENHFAPVEQVGFITNDKWGFTLGYSPDGKIVGKKAGIEAKSRCGKYQVQTIAADEVPDEYSIQVQTGLLVAEWEFIDFISYCGGLPMFVKRVEPIAEIQEAIIAGATAFEARVAEVMQEYHSTVTGMRKVIETERRIDQEMHIG